MLTVTMSADKFAQRAYEVGLIDSRQLESIWSELGTRDVSLEAMVAVMVRKELLTNFQADRILKGERIGYFYGKYKVLYLIGAGTFARVYRAVNVDTGRVVAVKVLRKRHRENIIEYEQFLREGKMGSDLRHVNVVPIYEVNGDRHAPFMVMEFVEGQTLRDMMKIRKKLDVRTALRILSDVVAGLAYAAEKGITHRDLKLSNVLISSSGRAKLVDFGLAAAQLEDDKMADCPNARAIDYAALERGTGVRKDDARSDLYFAGCLMYSMLSGHSPLSETKDRLQRLNISRFRDIPSLNELEPGLPIPVLAMVHKAMELDPEKRYQSAAEMHRDIQSLLQRLESATALAAATPTTASVPQESSEPENGGITAQEAAAPATEDVLEGDGRKLLVVESSIQLQDLFRDRLKKRGYRVLIISDPQRALDRLRDDATAADCVIFSASDLGHAAVDGFNRLADNGATKSIPAILILDQKQRTMASEAHLADHRGVLVAPKMGILRQALMRLLKNGQ